MNKRCLLEFPTELGIEIHMIAVEDTPKLTFPSEYIYGYGVYISNNYYWEPLELKYIDPLSTSGSTYFIEWINLFYYNPKIGKMGYTTGYKKNMILSYLDPLGTVINKWTLKGCHLDIRKEVVPDLENCELTLKFDRAFLM